MRAVDRWAIEERGIPSLELMERAGEGVARAVEEIIARRSAWSWCVARATTAATALLSHDCCARRAGRWRRVRGTARRSSRPTRAPTSIVCPVRRRCSSHEPGRARRARAGRARSSTRCLAQASQVPAWRRRRGDRGCQRGAWTRAERGRAQRCGRLHRDRRWRGDRGTVTVSFHAGKPGLWIHPGKGCAGDVRCDRDWDSARRASSERHRFDRRGRARRASAQGSARPSSRAGTSLWSVARAG